MNTTPPSVPAATEPRGKEIESYVKLMKSIEEKKSKLMDKDEKDIDALYGKHVNAKKITCDDKPDKETKIDRILTIDEFPGKEFTFRDVKMDSKMLDIMEKDWDYSSTSKREVFRTICLDPATSDIFLTPDRIEGDATSVSPDWTLCDKSFPGKKYTLLGGMHTHPDFVDKPLESMGDILVFSSSDKEMLSCTVTRWGTLCMFRMKEPAPVFDIPALDTASDPSKPKVSRDKKGKIIYDVKSDVVDWNRAMQFANRGLANSMFIVSRGKLNSAITEKLTRVPWFKPGDKEKSVGTIDVPFKFGVQKSSPKIVKDMKCESFVDIIGTSTKVRTACDDDTQGNNFYVESEITPGRLFFYDKNGFPSNFYSTRDVKVNAFQPLPEGSSTFWNYVDKARPGYLKSRSEKFEKMIGTSSAKKTVRSAAFKLDGEYQCEYLLMPFPESDEENDTGKPGGILCRKPEKERSGKACILA